MMRARGRSGSEHFSDFADESGGLRAGVDGKSRPIGAALQVREQPGRVFMEMQKRRGFAIEDAAPPLDHSVECAKLGQNRFKRVESLVAGMFHCFRLP
jgi:hypothetical protein